jgi:hypothetical protein
MDTDLSFSHTHRRLTKEIARLEQLKPDEIEMELSGSPDSAARNQSPLASILRRRVVPHQLEINRTEILLVDGNRQASFRIPESVFVYLERYEESTGD